MKMVLDAPAVARLLELDPDGTVELAKNAASQVAQEIAYRLCREAITRRTAQIVDADLGQNNFWHTMIAPKYQQVIAANIAAAAHSFAQSVADGGIKGAIDKVVDAAFAARQEDFERRMRDRADAILRERFGAMFAGQAGRL
jgi:hypothetical protein